MIAAAKERSSHSCWKAADLRGTYPDEISAELFERIGGAIGTFLGAGIRVMVAGDFRLSTPALKAALTRGLVSTGTHVLDAGQLPTPVAYFSERQHKPHALLIVTASHNPPDHNGLKLLLHGRPPTPEQLVAIRELAEGGAFRNGEGVVTRIEPLGAYERGMLRRWRHLDPASLPQVILDAGNGVWSEIAPRIFAGLGFPVDCISCVIDGSFPDRPSDCSRPANLARLRELVRGHKNAIGIAWDGDGDRVAFIDETGRAVTADEVSMLLVREKLAQARHQVVVDIKLSSGVEQEIRRLGGTPLLERTGHAFMRTRMIDTRALLGLDACGHFFFGELHGADDGLFAALQVLEVMQRARLPLGELLKALPSTFGSPELRIPLELVDFEHAEGLLLGAFSGAAVDRLDGIRLSVPEGIVLLRKSGTEAVLSLRVEGNTQAKYEMLLARCADLFPTARAVIQSQLEEHRAPVSS